MSRLLAVLLALTDLTLVSSPAHAAARTPVELTIHASASKVAAGDQVTIYGKARHADLRTRVQLQSRVAGVWTRVQGQRISNTRHYSFTVAPPRGFQHYRVVTVRRTHQKVFRSPAVDVAGTWQPSLALTGTPTLHQDGTQWVQLSGNVTDGPDFAVVDLQSRSLSSTWGTVTTFTPTDGTFGMEVPRSPRQLYRAVLHATGVTPEVESMVADSQASPYVLDLGHETEVDFSPTATTATVLLRDVLQGQEVTLVISDHASDDPWQASMQAPDLTEVGHVGSNCLCTDSPAIQFTAQESGTYEIHLVTDQDFMTLDLTASAAIELQLVQDGPAESYSTSVRGQEVIATFHADAGDAFVVVDPNSGASDLATDALGEPDGTTLAPLVRRDHSRGYDPIYLADQTGTYTYRYSLNVNIGTGSIRILRAAQTTATVDGDPVSVQVDTPGHVSLVWADLAAGDVVSAANVDSNNAQVLQNQGEEGYLPEIVGQGGERLVVVRCCTTDLGPAIIRAGSPLELDADVDGDPPSFDVTGWGLRAVDVTFSGSEGQVVEPYSTSNLNLYEPKLYDADGTLVTRIDQDAWVLPADGRYLMRTYLYSPEPGTIGLRTVPVVDVPTDGSATTVTLSHGDGLALGRLVAPAGTRSTRRCRRWTTASTRTGS